ncbi:site-specific integrase [Spirosoma flavus]
MITIRIDERDPSLLAISFPTDPIGNELIREVKGRRWSYSRRCWLVPNTRQSLSKIGQLFGKEYCRFDEALVQLYKPTATTTHIQQATNPPWPPLGKASTHQLFRNRPSRSEFDQHPVINTVSQVLRRQHYSYKTLTNYKQALITLLKYMGDKALDELTKTDYQHYLLFLVEKKRYSAATLNVHINAWKFYQEKVLQREKTYYEVAYPRQATQLPTVYSIDEVKAIFKATTSLKYRTLFKLVYATGLRVGEVVALRLVDLDPVRRLITVRAGKGKKDRVVMFSAKLQAEVDEYLNRHRPKRYVFEEAELHEPLAKRGIQQVYSQAVVQANIQKRGGIHTLHHSFATHLQESGMDIRYIQHLLGHESILTTMRYTHVSAHQIGNLKSPLDDL